MGYLSRLAYAMYIVGGALADGETVAERVRRETNELRLELHPGEFANVAVAVGVVEHGYTDDHWRTLERLAEEVTIDLRCRFPEDWQYPILVYPE